MKGKTWAAALSLIVAAATPLQAQSCSDFFPMKEGTVLRYVNYDKKDRVTGASEMSMEKKETSEGVVSATFTTRLFDDKGDPLFDGSLEASCEDGSLVFDASRLLDPATMSAYESMEVEVSGDQVKIPVKAPAGTVLEDAGVTAEVRSNGMKIMTIEVNVTNRRIEAHETIETPAGSFDCTKYAYDALTKAGFVKVESSGIEWYHPDYGTIRSESYDKKGKLAAYSVLESVRE